MEEIRPRFATIGAKSWSDSEPALWTHVLCLWQIRLYRSRAMRTSAGRMQASGAGIRTAIYHAVQHEGMHDTSNA